MLDCPDRALCSAATGSAEYRRPPRCSLGTAVLRRYPAGWLRSVSTGRTLGHMAWHETGFSVAALTGGIVAVCGAVGVAANSSAPLLIPPLVVTGVLLLIVAARLALGAAAEVVPPPMATGLRVYTLVLSVAVLGGSLLVMWAGFSTSPVDPVPILGGALGMFGSWAFMLLFIRGLQFRDRA